MQETQVQSLGQQDSLEKEWLSTPVFLPGKSHGQRSLVGCSPRGHKELDMIERLTHTIRSLSFVDMRLGPNSSNQERKNGTLIQRLFWTSPTYTDYVYFSMHK